MIDLLKSKFIRRKCKNWAKALIYRKRNNILASNSKYWFKLLEIDAEILEILETIKVIKYESEDFIGANNEKYLIEELNSRKLLYEFKTYYNREFKDSTQIFRSLSKSTEIFYSAIDYLSNVIVKVDDDITLNSEEYKDQININSELILERAFLKVDLNNIFSALSDISKILNKDFVYERAYFCKGKAKSIIEDFEGAIKEYSHLIQINPINQEAYLCRGKARIRLREKQISDQNSEYLFQTDPQKNKKKTSEDIFTESLNDFQNAISDFTKVIAINPNNENALIERGK